MKKWIDFGWIASEWFLCLCLGVLVGIIVGFNMPRNGECGGFGSPRLTFVEIFDDGNGGLLTFNRTEYGLEYEKRREKSPNQYPQMMIPRLHWERAQHVFEGGRWQTIYTGPPTQDRVPPDPARPRVPPDAAPRNAKP